jgi:hypothetical protein
VSDALRRVLTTRAQELESETGFVERSTAQLDGPTFVQTTVFDERGQCWDLVSFLGEQTGDEVDVQVVLGKRERLLVRLIARRVSSEQAERRRKSATCSVEGKPKGVQRPNERTRQAVGDKRKRKKTGKARLQLLGWTILITNVPQALLTVDEVLARCRWQIELCWKPWK